MPAALADRYGDRIAIEEEERTWTYTELADAVERVARAHRDLAGETVLLRWSNRVEMLVQLFGLSRVGAVVAPVKAALTQAELRTLAVSTGATAAVGEPGLWVPELSGVPGSMGSDPAAGSHTTRGSDTAVLLCTSGTTGTPKAAALSHAGLRGSRLLLVAPLGRRWGPRGGRDAVLSALPLSHVMGLVAALRALVAGVTWIHRARFDADEVLSLVETRRPNAFIGVPTMYADLEAAGAVERDLSSIQLWISSADAMPTERARRFQALGSGSILGGHRVGWATFLDVYGMVELSGPAGFRVLPPVPAPLPVPYLLRPGFSVRAVAPDGRALGFGAQGELQFRGPGVMSGYRGRDRGLVHGWLSTGDHGRVAPGGLFWVSGREHDRLKVGGFSVFPAEVEAVLDTVPGVREVAVVGLPDPRLGDRPVALVVPGEGFDLQALEAWSRAHLVGYRRPRAFHVVSSLPRGSNGKIDRREATRLGRLVAEHASSGRAPVPAGSAGV